VVLRSSARKVTAAKDSAYGFVLGLRTGNKEAVKAFTTTRLNAAIEAIDSGGPSDRELARRLDAVRISKVFAGTFVGDWTEGCVDGDLDSTAHLWLRLDLVGATWRVDSVQIGAMPNECLVPKEPPLE
jgi:hypothetical protein